MASTYPPKLAASTFPCTKQELVVYFESLLQPPTSTFTTTVGSKVNTVLTTINQKAIPFINTYVSRNDNLVLTTTPHHQALIMKLA
jgi:hypothetical protein